MELRKATHARQRNIRLPISEEFAVEKDMKITLDGAALHTMHGDAESLWLLHKRLYSLAHQ